MTESTLLRTAEDKRNASLSNLQGHVGVAMSELYLKASAQLDRTQHYKYFPPNFHHAIADIANAHGDEVAQEALQLSIWNALVEVLRSGRFESLPARVRHHQAIQINRMFCAQYDNHDWLAMDSDLFHKEFGIASLRLYAAAAQLVDPSCGLPRSVVFKAGLSDFRSAIRVITAVRGFRPMFQIHTHLRYTDEFNDEGWNECYRTCVDLYAIHPKCLGIYGGSWFYDPVVSVISPRLSYLSDVPKAGHAHFLLGSNEGEFVRDAISTSPSRRKLFEDGQYKPRSFYMIWGRRDQTIWAQRNLST